mmetsp:Transcript_127837/g.368116  ORF Transcript_127837/g.368116 Transcript_127837/m.368116 type:complete len:215 (-) Transcript_127837:8-652(-)
MLLEELHIVLLLRLDRLAPRGAICLVVVDELVQDVPNPLRRHHDGQCLTLFQVADDEVQQHAVILPRSPPVIEAHLQPRVNVAVVQLLVQDDEQRLVRDLILHRLRRRPLLVLVVVDGQLIECVLVKLVDLGDRPLLQGLEQHAQEMVDRVRDGLLARRRALILARVALGFALAVRLLSEGLCDRRSHRSACRGELRARRGRRKVARLSSRMSA